MAIDCRERAAGDLDQHMSTFVGDPDTHDVAVGHRTTSKTAAFPGIAPRRKVATSHARILGTASAGWGPMHKLNRSLPVLVLSEDQLILVTGAVAGGISESMTNPVGDAARPCQWCSSQQGKLVYH